MKKIGVLIFSLLCLSLFSLVIAVDGPPSVPGGEDMEDIQGAIDQIPIDEGGGIDDEKISGFKSKAEERIEKINEYVGPISNFLFGVELTLSWIFVFSVLMWILLIEIIAAPVADIFNKNILWGLGLGGVIATLAMQSFGDNFITWIDSLAQTWYASLFVIVIAIVFGVVYQVIMKTLGKKMKASKLASEREKTGKAQKVIQTHGRVSRKELESYKVGRKK